MIDKFDPYINKIDELNLVLDATINLANSTLSLTETLENLAITEAQAKVDDVCMRISEEANKKIDEKRSDLVKCLHEKYLSTQEIVSLLQPIIEAKLTDLNSVIKVLTNIIKIYAGPYYNAVEEIAGLTKVVAPKLVEVTEKVAYLSTLPNQIPIPEDIPINYDKLNITMKPITIEDIITGNVS